MITSSAFLYKLQTLSRWHCISPQERCLPSHTAYENQPQAAVDASEYMLDVAITNARNMTSDMTNLLDKHKLQLDNSLELLLRDTTSHDMDTVLSYSLHIIFNMVYNVFRTMPQQCNALDNMLECAASYNKVMINHRNDPEYQHLLQGAVAKLQVVRVIDKELRDLVLTALQLLLHELTAGQQHAEDLWRLHKDYNADERRTVHDKLMKYITTASEHISNMPWTMLRCWSGDVARTAYTLRNMQLHIPGGEYY